MAIQLSLLTFDAIQAMGNVLDIRWVNIGKVFTGSYCTAQGASTFRVPVSQF